MWETIGFHVGYCQVDQDMATSIRIVCPASTSLFEWAIMPLLTTVAAMTSWHMLLRPKTFNLAVFPRRPLLATSYMVSIPLIIVIINRSLFRLPYATITPLLLLILRGPPPLLYPHIIILHGPHLH